MSRAELQTKITQLIADNPNIDVEGIRALVRTHLDSLDLKRDSLSHEFIRDRIMNDLNTYEGLENDA